MQPPKNILDGKVMKCTSQLHLFKFVSAWSNCKSIKTQQIKIDYFSLSKLIGFQIWPHSVSIIRINFPDSRCPHWVFLVLNNALVIEVNNEKIFISPILLSFLSALMLAILSKAFLIILKVKKKGSKSQREVSLCKEIVPLKFFMTHDIRNHSLNFCLCICSCCFVQAS